MDPSDLTTWAPVLQLGPLGVVVLLVLTGRLVSRSMMREITTRQQETINTQQELINELVVTLPEIVNYMQLTKHVLDEFKERTTPPGGGS